MGLRRVFLDKIATRFYCRLTEAMRSFNKTPSRFQAECFFKFLN